jgi:hypothetical protein
VGYNYHPDNSLFSSGIDIEVDIFPEEGEWNTRIFGGVKFTQPDIQIGADILSGDGQEPHVWLQEFYTQKEFDFVDVTIGKQTFSVDSIVPRLESINLDPFVSQDFSGHPFHVMDQKLIGQWGTSVKLWGEQLELIAMVPNLAYQPLDSDNLYIRDLPNSLQYGDLKQNAGHSIGARWSDIISLSDKQVNYLVFVQQGLGNTVVDADVNMLGEVQPIFAEQFSIGLLAETSLVGLIVRGELLGIFLSGYDDYVVGVLEAEKILQNILADGDSFTINIGVSDVFDLDSDNSGIPGLDYRRITDGLTTMIGANWTSPDEQWEIEGKCAINVEKSGLYGELGASYAPEDVDWAIEALVSYVTGDDENLPDSHTNSWAATEGAAVQIRLTWNF